MRTDALRRAQRALLAVMVLAAAAIALGAWLGSQGLPGRLSIFDRPPLAGRRVGIVAGHSGSDSGAVCPDGLTEAEVNEDIARRVVRRLEARGARVDLLQEFDSRLAGYRADAFVSIHADSCAVALSGYKVARSEGGSLVAEGLVQCLWDKYEAATGLPRHPDTITYDMTRYHAFREIAPETPAAIIEVGFLGQDRELLTRQPERVAGGIAEGIECYLAR